MTDTLASGRQKIAPFITNDAPAVGFHVELREGQVTIASDSAAIAIPLERVGDVLAWLARIYDAQVTGTLPRTREQARQQAKSGAGA